MRRTVLALMAVVTIGLWTSGEVRAGWLKKIVTPVTQNP